MFIIDFDGTLFDTYKYVQDRMGELSPLGVSQELYRETYKLARNAGNGLSVYSDQRHAQVLAEAGFDAEKIYWSLKKITDNAQNYVFSDAFWFLEKLRKEKEKMILLSLGEPAYQEEKINKSGVHKYFDRVFMVQDSKEHVLWRLFEKIKKTDAWFVNDKIDETKKLIGKFSQLRAVLKFSPFFLEKEYRESGLPYFLSLKEIGDYILKYGK